MVGGCGASEQPEMSGIAKSTAAVCDGGGGGGGGNSASMVDVGNRGPVVHDGCDQGAAGLPEAEPRSGAKKGEKQVAQLGDAAVGPVASTSFKRSGGTGSGSSGGGRRAVQKRVVTVPISDIGEGSRARSNGSSVGAAGGGDAAPPPSDSWTWRKYGQKPIKGSPYPRGYYRCSSSKGCPARKQVERSRADPSMLIVTYASEHNHPWPTPRISSHHASRQSVAAAQAAGAGTPPPQQMVAAGKPIPPVPPLASSSSTDEEDMEVEYENAALEEEEEVKVKVKVKEKILAELDFSMGITGGTTISTSTMTTTTTTTVASTATTSTAPTATTSSPTSEETETFSAEHSALSGGGSDVDSTTLIPPLAPEAVVVVDDDDLCSTWFPSISLCSTSTDTAGTMLPFSYDELLADLGGRSGGGGGYGVDEDEESMFAGLGELPEFSLVFRRGILPEHAADFRR